MSKIGLLKPLVTSGLLILIATAAIGTGTAQAEVNETKFTEAGYFGFSVATDGNNAIVAAPLDLATGTASIIHFDGTAWGVQQKLIPPDGANGDLFGESVAIDGNIAVVGSRYNNETGAAYVYEFDGSAWMGPTKLEPVDLLPGDEFGTGVAIDGDTIVVGAHAGNRCSDPATGAVYVFRKNGVFWDLEAKLMPSDGQACDSFGFSVAIDDDVIVVGSLYANSFGYGDTGAVYVFRYDGTTWAEETILVPTYTDGYSNEFGTTVDISGDNVVVGSTSYYIAHDFSSLQNAIPVFHFDGVNWGEETVLTVPESSGTCCQYQAAIDGNTIVTNGRSPSGDLRTAVVFQYDEGQWAEYTRLQASDSTPGNGFGHSVQIGNGSIVVGAININAAYIYQLTAVVNTPPTITGLDPSTNTIDENNWGWLDVAFMDPDTNTHMVVIDWGDGSSDDIQLTSGQRAFTASHQYLDDSPSATPSDTYTINVTVTDNEGGNDQDSAVVTVNNVVPTVGPISAPAVLIPVGTSIVATAAFTDVGTLDSHTAVWNWGDNTTSTGIVTEANGSGTITGEHTYLIPGVYTVQLTVTDDDGASAESVLEFIVIYNPNGGYVTGVGSIDSPAGAFAANPDLTGQANFGILARYNGSPSFPTGKTQFSFPAANINFMSTSYSWLVVYGDNAIYQGTGTINGSGNYGFSVTVFDGITTGAPDRYRIRIWDINNGNAEVYDNGYLVESMPTQAISSGKIVIHH